MKRVKILSLILSIFCFVLSLVCFNFSSALAMPFYNLSPKELVLRAEFYTSFTTSTTERKHNIFLASSAFDNFLLAPNEEFSFNRVVGARTEKRGFKQAKIIVNGEFVDGVGGGVCQVSTTLYNAVLLSGLEVIEYHPHSLPVSYVSPSFDAMVNSGGADLKFINNTKKPVIIRTFADNSTLKIQIFGEPMTEKFVRKSVVIESIPAPDYEEVFDENLEYPDLFEGESKIVRYAKDGLKSEGYLYVFKDGKLTKSKKIRSDKYLAMRGKIVKGKAVRLEIKNDFALP